jgi:hypothetical protein
VVLERQTKDTMVVRVATQVLQPELLVLVAVLGLLALCLLLQQLLLMVVLVFIRVLMEQTHQEPGVVEQLLYGTELFMVVLEVLVAVERGLVQPILMQAQDRLDSKIQVAVRVPLCTHGMVNPEDLEL